MRENVFIKLSGVEQVENTCLCCVFSTMNNSVAHQKITMMKLLDMDRNDIFLFLQEGKLRIPENHRGDSQVKVQSGYVVVRSGPKDCKGLSYHF